MKWKHAFFACEQLSHKTDNYLGKLSTSIFKQEKNHKNCHVVPFLCYFVMYFSDCMHF